MGEKFEHPFLLWRRLQRLYHAGFLARPPGQRWRDRMNPGNTDHVYALGNKGAQELARLGFPLPKIDWDQRAKDLKPYSFEHPLLVARFLTCFSLAVQKAPGLAIVELYPEGKFHDEVTFFDGTEEVTLPIKPDATLVVEDKRDSHTERLGIFAEADRWTMPLRRATFKQSSFYKKLLAYYHYWLKRGELRERLGVDDFIVLTVCEEEARTIALRELAKEADEEQRGTDIFWFTSKAALSLDEPQTILLRDVWTTATGERGSLF